MMKNDHEKTLTKMANEINILNSNIDQMYVDKLNHKITEEMYERLFEKFREEIKQKENDYQKIKQQEELKQDNTENIKNIVQEFLNFNDPTPETLKVIINKIEIHQDKQIDLYLNFNAYFGVNQKR